MAALCSGRLNTSLCMSLCLSPSVSLLFLVMEVEPRTFLHAFLLNYMKILGVTGQERNIRNKECAMS